jgi:hypothetical protein
MFVTIVTKPFFDVFLGLKPSSVTGLGVKELDVKEAESVGRY